MKELNFEIAPHDGMLEARGDNEVYAIYEYSPEKVVAFNGEDIYKSNSLLDCIIFCNNHYFVMHGHSWTKLDKFHDWLRNHPDAATEVPQSIAQVLGMGYGADDPVFQRLVEDFKVRHEAQCNCHVREGNL